MRVFDKLLQKDISEVLEQLPSSKGIGEAQE